MEFQENVIVKVLALFDQEGTIHALFHPSTEANAPQLNFQPASGQRAQLLEVPPELQNLSPTQLHAEARVDLSSGSSRLIARKKE
jgi:hypothetical protein